MIKRILAVLGVVGLLMVGLSGTAAATHGTPGHSEQPDNPDHNDEIPGCEPSDNQPKKCELPEDSEQGPEVPVANPRVRDHGSVIEFCWPEYVFLDVATGAGDWTLTLNERVETFSVSVDEVSDVTFLKARGFEVDRSELPLTVTLSRGDGFTPLDEAVLQDCPVSEPKPESPSVDTPEEVVTEVIVDNPPVKTVDDEEVEVVATPAASEELPRTGIETPLFAALGLALLGAGWYTLRRA